MLNIRTYTNTIYGAESDRDDSYLYTLITDNINDLLSAGKDKFIVYPMGRLGQMVVQILQYRYRLEPVACVDDCICGIAPGVLSRNQIGSLPDDSILLISSNNPQIYEQIRANAGAVLPASRILDLFPLKPLYKKDSRIISLELASREIHKYQVPGAVAEVGVYRGYFAEHINLFFPDRHFYLFDTFCGFDPRDCEIEETLGFSDFKAGSCFLDTSIEIVADKMVTPENCTFLKGYFPETAQDVPPDERFCFVHLDTDLYHPTLRGLEYFYPRLNAGGYIFVHDFNGPAQGVRTAVREFCAKNHVGYMCLPDSIACGTAVIAKGL